MRMHPPKLRNRRMLGMAALLSLASAQSPAQARVFGSNALTSPASRVRDGDAGHASVGRIECRSTDGQSRSFNGFLIGSPRLMIASRQPLDRDLDPGGGGKCAARFFTPRGALVDTVGISRVAALAGSDSRLFVMETESRYAGRPARHLHGDVSARLDDRPVRMVTLATQADGSLSKVGSPGSAFRLLNARAGEAGTSGLRMAVDYDSVSASRGSPVFDAAGAIAGVHSGSVCPVAGGDPAFDRNACYNEMTLIGDREHSWIMAEAAKLRAGPARRPGTTGGGR